MTTQNTVGITLAGICVAIGMAAAGFFVSQTIYNANVAINTAEVKGLAERRVRADYAHWVIGYSLAGPNREAIPELYKQAEQQRQEIIGLLKQGGFDDQEIQAGILNYYHQEYRDHGQIVVDEQHSINGSVSVETAKVDQIAKVRASLNQLIAKGYSIENREPVYRYTSLNEIKPDMVREATKNARLAAQEFADNAGVEVGGIRSARQGGFIIRDAGADYGGTAKIEKDVRVVTTITFYLTR